MVGSIFPDTSAFAKQYWSKLINYCFFGPIMLFMVFLATKMMDSTIAESLKTKITASTSGGGAIDADLLAGMCNFVVPMVILWLGLAIAQQMSIAGASAVVGKAQSIATSVGRGATIGAAGFGAGMMWKGTKGAAKGISSATGLTGGAKQAWDDVKKKGIKGLGGSEKREDKEATVAEFFKVKDAKKKRTQTRNKEKIKNEADTHESLDATALAGDVNSVIAAGPTSETDKKKMIGNAAKAKAFMGKKGSDKAIENHVKGTTAFTSSLTLSAPATAVTSPYTTAAARAAKVKSITPGMDPADIERIKLEIKALDEQDRQVDMANADEVKRVEEQQKAYDKEYKEKLEEAKAKYLDEIDKVIKHGETA